MVTPVDTLLAIAAAAKRVVSNYWGDSEEPIPADVAQLEDLLRQFDSQEAGQPEG